MGEEKQKLTTELQEAFKKIQETNTNNILKSLTEALKQPLPKRNEIDYICSLCSDCLFFEEINMGMDGTVYLCQANEPNDEYFNARTMRWVSACDCGRDCEIKEFYYRKCKNYCSMRKVMKEKLKGIKGV